MKSPIKLILALAVPSAAHALRCSEECALRITMLEAKVRGLQDRLSQFHSRDMAFGSGAKMRVNGQTRSLMQDGGAKMPGTTQANSDFSGALRHGACSMYSVRSMLVRAHNEGTRH